jgi:beta-lactamase regulating signal transducer with metallopeptidase domain
MKDPIFLASLLHLVFSSLVVFFAIALVMEACFFLFRVKSARVRSIFRLLLIVKLPLDILLYKIFQRDLFYNFNPFSCEQYLERFILNMFPALKAQNLSFAEIMAATIPSFWLKGSLFVVLLVFLISIARKIELLFISNNYIKKIKLHAKLCQRAITSETLQHQLQKQKAVILVTEEINIPFAAKNRFIFLPSSLLQELSQEEFESVVAHELEHLRFRDPLTRVICEMILSLFWWIPMKWWVKKLELEQERASDASVTKYNLDTHALASAVVKSASKAKKVKYGIAALCNFSCEKSAPMKRLASILHDLQFEKRSVRLVGKVFCLTFVLILFWIC